MTDKKSNVEGLSIGDFCGGKCDIETSILESYLNETKVCELRKVGENLRQNLKMPDTMITLPYVICSFMNVEFQKAIFEIKGRLASGVYYPDKADKESRRKYAEKMTEIMETEVKHQRYKMAEEMMEQGDKAFIGLLENELISTPYYKGILWSVITLMWCSIEVFMRELWETSLNIGGKTIIGNVLKELGNFRREQNDNDIQGKLISIEYLSKYDFNLSKVLGTVLLHKFDFSSLSGIKEAFLYAFPRSDAIKKAVESEILSELSAKRNVIVHNGGIIDAEYCSRVSMDRKNIGEKLAIDNNNICRLGKGVMDIAITMMDAVSSIVLADRSQDVGR